MDSPEAIWVKETLASGNCSAWLSAICVFFAALYPRTAAASSSVMMVGGDPLQALLEGALGQQTACHSSDFTFRKR
jgi:hypothetical protein